MEREEGLLDIFGSISQLCLGIATLICCVKIERLEHDLAALQAGAAPDDILDGELRKILVPSDQTELVERTA